MVEKILAVGNKGPWKVKEVKETEVKRSPRAPFTTSTLQQTASSRLGFSPSRTMMIAQRLYEAGHISYMRTDSTTLSTMAVGQISGLVEKKFGKEYFAARQYDHEEQKRPRGPRSHQANERAARVCRSQRRAREALQAHLAAHGVFPDGGSKEICAPKSRPKPAKPTKYLNSHITGSRVLFDGWLAADPEARQDDVELPKVIAGDALNLIEIKSQEKQTEPPGRYSEAGLVKELEKRDIGRPSTYASIIKTLLDRGYVEKLDRSL